ncbi:MAG TPA: hypothetical protein V6C89_15495 [Drouetiella sp.]|jgi:hypothetical protein
MARDPLKEKQWRRRLQAWRDSGLTVSQYCKREGLNDHNFRSWQATIKQRDEEQFQKAMTKKYGDYSEYGDLPTTFVPVELTNEPHPAKQTAPSVAPKSKELQIVAQQLALEILTPTGHIFRIFGSTDPGLLRVILASLGRHEC